LKPIQNLFERMPKVMAETLHFDIDAVDPKVVDDDIQKLVRDEMGRLGRHLVQEGLSADFLDETSIKRLARKADRLFIYAKIACRFIWGNHKNESRTPKDHMDAVPTNHRFKNLDSMYAEILERAVCGDDTAALTEQLRELLELLVGLFRALPENALVKLSRHRNPHIVRSRLVSLQSVLNVPSPADGCQPVTIFHDTFRTFLVENAAPRFLSSQNSIHRTLFTRTIQLLAGSLTGLKRDILDLGSSDWHVQFKRRSSKWQDLIPVTNLEENMASEVFNASRKWGRHLSCVPPNMSGWDNGIFADSGPVARFLQKHFLHWFELVSFATDGTEALESIEAVQLHLSRIPTAGNQLKQLVSEGIAFIRDNRELVNLLPLQIYTAPLLHTPKDSLLRKLYYHERWPFLLDGPSIAGNPRPDRQPGFTTLDVVSNSIAVGTYDKMLYIPSNFTILLWSELSGIWNARALIRIPHCSLNKVTFSADGLMLAIAAEKSDELLHLPNAAWQQEHTVVIIPTPNLLRENSEKDDVNETVFTSKHSPWIRLDHIQALVAATKSEGSELDDEEMSMSLLDDQNPILAMAFSSCGREMVTMKWNRVFGWSVNGRNLWVLPITAATMAAELPPQLLVGPDS
jgi:hypothetical protein